MILEKINLKGGKYLASILIAFLPPLFFSSLFLLFFSVLPSLENQYSFAIYSKDEKLLCASLSKDETYCLPISHEINSMYKTASIAYEDKSFYLHYGIDASSVVRAIFTNISSNKTVSGASTLTMQLSRLASKAKSRNYFQKLKEAFFALLFEVKYTKDEIFQLYSSLAPFGGNVVGIEGAAFRYFSTSQNNLSIAEASMLAVLPNQPSFVSLKTRRERLKEKRDSLLKVLKGYSIISVEERDLSISEPLTASPHSLPFFAMHYHDLLKKKAVLNGDEKNKKLITTIDYNTQILLEKMTNEHSARLKENLIFNMASLVMEVETENIVAYVGNTGFFSKTGKDVFVDMVQAKRSSGSLLKPFLYAAMLDRGLIFPSSLLKDVPTQIQGYSPQNNNGGYEGVVKADEALSRSLNIPFVRSLREYGIAPFLKLLKECGFSTFTRSAEEYGLPLILGGGELTLFEAAKVYSRLTRQACGGEVKDFPISQGAAYLALEALEKGKRGSEEGAWQFFSNAQKIAWKTGTSDGFKDAWSIGTNGKYIVAVWAGNANGTGRPEIRSNIAATPLMFEIFSVLEKQKWISPPLLSLREVSVCAHSHYASGMYCNKKRGEYVPVNAPLAPVCPYCKPICLSADGKHRIFPQETTGKEKIEHMFVLPPFEESLYLRHHKDYHVLPPFLNKRSSKDDVQIIFPESYDKIAIPIEISGRKGAFTAKAVHKDAQATLYWDVDGSYLGTTRRFHQLDINVKSGRHVLTVTDQNGVHKDCVFFVE